MQKVGPFLWFDNQAEQAADFYLTVFPNAKKLGEQRWPAGGPPGSEGRVLIMSVEIEGQEMTFLNGGPGHPPTDAFSLFVRCEDQAEIDGYWEKFIAAGGTEGRCGWLKDHFGVSWQITPRDMGKLINNPGGMKAMMTMTKLDIAAMEAART